MKDATQTMPVKEFAAAVEVYRAAAEVLLEHLPALHRAVRPEEPLEKLPGWEALRQKPRVLVETGGEPVLTATLHGPTGAGKSTLFTLLSGVEVPRAIKRPTSHACALAVPPVLGDPAKLARLFPDFHLLPLEDTAVLTRERQPVGNLHYRVSRRSAGPGETLSLALADVPDFNSIDSSNWEKAERMLARAEVVVFITYPESYKDAVVVRNLLPVCRRAGHLLFVFNKIPAAGRGEVEAVARELREDLLSHLQSAESGFGEKRADGLAAHEFFARAPCYAAPHDANLTLESITPLNPESPAFADALRGLDGGRIFLANLMEVAAGAVDSCRRLLDGAEEAANQLETDLGKARECVEREAAFAAGSQFPIGQLLFSLAEEARSQRPAWMRPLAWPGRALGQTFQTVRQISRYLGKERDELAPREKLETERLREAAERLTDDLRGTFPAEIGGRLRADACREAREAFARRPLPDVGTDWEESVRRSGREWARENRLRATALATLCDLLMVGGVASVALDLVAFGGAGTVGVVAAAGVGAGAAAFFLDMFGRLGLRQVLVEADRRWREQRTEEMAAHLEQWFADPLLLGAWKERLAVLRDIPRDALREACENMERLRRNQS